MSRLKAANNAQTALAALMDATATTCTVVNGDILPAVPFRASIDSEIIEVGAKAGNNLSSILRGQEGTAAAAHQSGSLVEGKMTAGMHNELLSTDEVIKNNYAATTAPTVNDDSGDGYAVGSKWINITADRGYICVDATVGAAVWMQIAGIVPACRVYNNANQSLADSTSVALAFNTESFDTDGMHDNTTHSTRLTCKTAGKYLINGVVRFAPNINGIRDVWILHNGSTMITYDRRNASSSGVTVISVTAIFDMAVNDYVELYAYQTSGGALDSQYSANYAPQFSMARIG